MDQKEIQRALDKALKNRTPRALICCTGLTVGVLASSYIAMNGADIRGAARRARAKPLARTLSAQSSLVGIRRALAARLDALDQLTDYADLSRVGFARLDYFPRLLRAGAAEAATSGIAAPMPPAPAPAPAPKAPPVAALSARQQKEAAAAQERRVADTEVRQTSLRLAAYMASKPAAARALIKTEGFVKGCVSTATQCPEVRGSALGTLAHVAVKATRPLAEKLLTERVPVAVATPSEDGDGDDGASLSTSALEALAAVAAEMAIDECAATVAGVVEVDAEEWSRDINDATTPLDRDAAAARAMWRRLEGQTDMTSVLFLLHALALGSPAVKEALSVEHSFVDALSMLVSTHAAAAAEVRENAREVPAAAAGSGAAWAWKAEANFGTGHDSDTRALMLPTQATSIAHARSLLRLLAPGELELALAAAESSRGAPPPPPSSWWGDLLDASPALDMSFVKSPFSAAWNAILWRVPDAIFGGVAWGGFSAALWLRKQRRLAAEPAHKLVLEHAPSVFKSPAARAFALRAASNAGLGASALVVAHTCHLLAAEKLFVDWNVDGEEEEEAAADQKAAATSQKRRTRRRQTGSSSRDANANESDRPMVAASIGLHAVSLSILGVVLRVAPFSLFPFLLAEVLAEADEAEMLLDF